MTKILFFIFSFLLILIYIFTPKDILNLDKPHSNTEVEKNIIQGYTQLELTKDEKDYIKNKKTITMCIDPHWMPFEEIKNKKHIGITSDYVDIFRKRIGIPIRLIVTSTWTESLQKAQDRECDIIPLLSKTKERKEYMDFTTPYINNPIVIATKVGIPFIENLDQIKDKKIAIVKGYSIYEKLRHDYPTLNIFEVDSLYEGLKAVEKNKIFAYLDNSTVINHAIQKSFLGNVTISGKIKYNFQFSVATRNDEPMLHQIFNAIILSIDETTKEKIFNKWIKVNYTTKTDYTLLLQLLVLSLLIICGTIYWNRKLSLLNKELSIERDKAKKLTETKSEFLANMSHEIRTPMNGIIGMSHLAMGSCTDERSKNYIDKIDKSAKSLLNIVNDILDFSKLEVGKLSIEKVEFNLNDVISNILNLTEVKIIEKDLELIVNYDMSQEEIFYGDPLRLTQIITNLMGNAIKFTRHGSVTLHIQKRANNLVEFSIEDTGIGISVDQIDKLFQSFSQADTSITRKYGGTGLGLSISKQLVELLDGKIWVKSKEGEGSIFSFEITLPQVYNYTQSKKEKIIDLDSIKEFLNKKTMFNILLVDENVINQEIIKGLLEKLSINITIALNETVAMETMALNNTNFDLILADILPATKLMRISKKNNIKITLIALTSDTTNCENILFDDYLTKPIQIEKLYRLLYKYLSRDTISNILQKNTHNDILHNMKYIDVRSALNRLNNNKKLYLKILKDFKINYENIDFYKMNENDYKLEVHTLFGLAGNIGAYKLYEILQRINEKNDKSLISDLHKRLDEVLNELGLLSKEENSISKEMISNKLQKKLFEDLEKSLENKRPKNITLVLSDIDKYELDEKYRVNFERIKKYIYTYNYKEALNLLRFINS